MKTLNALVAAALLAAALPSQSAEPRATAQGARPSPMERAHALALDSFRRARFSEAYGRFISLADAGHPASARYEIGEVGVC